MIHGCHVLPPVTAFLVGSHHAVVAPRLVCPDADHLIPLAFIVGPANRLQVAVHGPDFQLDSAEPGHRVGQILALADDRFERLSIPAAGVEVHHGEALFIVAILQPGDRRRPALGALADELQGCGVLLTAVGEKYEQVAQVIVVVEHLAQHVSAGAAA
ncbi:hypothetical protein [Pseudomonas sp. UM16]|uniref:hypothetical protein n=1 Tax=Pseudomonas sp. UM16 TaxID=3158962 RepID=UPI0039901205